MATKTAERKRRVRRVIDDKSAILDQRGHAKLLVRDPLRARRNMERTPIQKRNDLIKALVECRGLIMLACEKAGVSYRAHRYWYHKRKHYRIRVNEALEKAYDLVEFSGIVKPANDGNLAAANAFLSARAKERGYGGYRQEVTGANGGPVELRGPSLEEIMEKVSPTAFLSMVERVAKNANKLDANILKLERKVE